jgi:hypothetical protein
MPAAEASAPRGSESPNDERSVRRPSPPPSGMARRFPATPPATKRSLLEILEEAIRIMKDDDDEDEDRLFFKDDVNDVFKIGKERHL